MVSKLPVTDIFYNYVSSKFLSIYLKYNVFGSKACLTSGGNSSESCEQYPNSIFREDYLVDLHFKLLFILITGLLSEEL